MDKLQLICEEVCKVISGKDKEIRLVLTAILAKGHILLEDIPGVGKTTMALAFSRALELDYRRLQFTPDVLPTDVVGFHLYGSDGHETGFKPGPVMCNLFLADEINRTSSKTQSALLEVMEEGKVTVDGITRAIPEPFIVIATQNPIGSVGTQKLPESELDRFMIRLSMGYPDHRSEVDILKERHVGDPMLQLVRIASRTELLQMQAEADKTFVHDALFDYIVRLVEATRENPMLMLGVSPRGSLAMLAMAKAMAYLNGRDYVIPEDVREVFEPVAAHRVMLSPKARVSQANPQTILRELLMKVALPKLG